MRYLTARTKALLSIVAVASWISIALTLLFATECRCEEQVSRPLSKADTARQWAVSSLLLVDAMQTMQAQRTPGYHERNGLIRQHWSQPGVRNYFVLTGVGAYAITRALPPEYRPAWQYGIMAAELYVITHNHKSGLRIGGQFGRNFK